MRTAAVGLVALASLLAFGAGAGARSSSGLRGVVMEGPTAPICRDGDSCEAPARGLVLQFRRSGKLVAEAKTTNAGRYSVRLRPGSYGVKAAHRRIGTGLSPKVVRVPRGRVGRVDFYLDTGIQ